MSAQARFKKRSIVYGILSGIFLGLDYALAGQVHTLLAMTFLVSLWLTSFHDLGVALTIGVINSKAIVRSKDLSRLRLILICCIPLLDGIAMSLNITYTIWGILFSAFIFNAHVEVGSTVIAALLIIVGNCLIIKSRHSK
jgi:hypothetical protein